MNQSPDPRQPKKTLWLTLSIGIIGIILPWGLAWVYFSLDEAIQLLAPATLSTAGVLGGATLVYLRWIHDYRQRELELDRLQARWSKDFEQRTNTDAKNRELEVNRFEIQANNDRRQQYGSRLKVAVEHISSSNAITQLAGLIELGGLSDDWMHFNNSARPASPKQGRQAVGSIQQDRIRLDVSESQRRLQEIISLIFTYPLPPVDPANGITPESQNSMIQQTRNDLFRSHTQSNCGVSSSTRIENWNVSWNHLSFSGAQLAGVECKISAYQGFNMRAANLHKAKLRGSTFRSINFQLADLSGADLTDVDFTGSDLRGANLQGALLRGAKFTHANLESANLNQTCLFGTDFTGAFLKSTRLVNIRIQNCVFSGATLDTEDFLIDVSNRLFNTGIPVSSVAYYDGSTTLEPNLRYEFENSPDFKFIPWHVSPSIDE